MKAKDFRARAATKMATNSNKLVLAYFIYFVILSTVSSTGIGYVVLGGPLTLGLVLFVIDVYEEKNPDFTRLFEGFNHFVNAMILYILQSLYIILWSFLLFVPGVIKRYAYSMSFFILKENPTMDADAAITQSRKMMKGHKWRLFCLMFSYIGWIILAVFTFGILMLWVAPKMELAKYEFYLDLKNRLYQYNPKKLEDELMKDTDFSI